MHPYILAAIIVLLILVAALAYRYHYGKKQGWKCPPYSSADNPKDFCHAFVPIVNNTIKELKSLEASGNKLPTAQQQELAMLQPFSTPQGCVAAFTKAGATIPQDIYKCTCSTTPNAREWVRKCSPKFNGGS